MMRPTIFDVSVCTWEIVFTYLKSTDICSLKETCNYIREVIYYSNVASKKLNFKMKQLLVCRNEKMVQTSVSNIKRLTINNLLPYKSSEEKMFYILENFPFCVTTLELESFLQFSKIRHVLYTLRHTLINLVVGSRFHSVEESRKKNIFSKKFVLCKLKRFEIATFFLDRALAGLEDMLPDTLQSIKYCRYIPCRITFENKHNLSKLLRRQTHLEHLIMNDIFSQQEMEDVVGNCRTNLKIIVVPFLLL